MMLWWTNSGKFRNKFTKTREQSSLSFPIIRKTKPTLFPYIYKQPQSLNNNRITAYKDKAIFFSPRNSAKDLDDI